jgi:hypothetical protein
MEPEKKSMWEPAPSKRLNMQRIQHLGSFFIRTSNNPAQLRHVGTEPETQLLYQVRFLIFRQSLYRIGTEKCAANVFRRRDDGLIPE